MMQGLVYLLAGEENAHSEAFDESDGPRLAVSVDAPCEEWVRGAFELAKACFVLLAERYPENVRFADVSRRGKESMMDLQLFAAEATAPRGGERGLPQAVGRAMEWLAAAETGSRGWGSGQQNTSAAQGTKWTLGAATRGEPLCYSSLQREKPLPRP